MMSLRKIVECEHAENIYIDATIGCRHVVAIQKKLSRTESPTTRLRYVPLHTESSTKPTIDWPITRLQGSGRDSAKVRVLFNLLKALKEILYIATFMSFPSWFSTFKHDHPIPLI